MCKLLVWLYLLRNVVTRHKALSFLCRPCTITPLVRLTIRFGTVDGFTICLQPFTNVCQSLLHDHRYPAIRGRTNVQEQVSATRDDVYQHEYKVMTGFIIFQFFIPVITVGMTNAATLFPNYARVHATAVFGGAIGTTGIFSTGVTPPPVVHYHFFCYR